MQEIRHAIGFIQIATKIMIRFNRTRISNMKAKMNKVARNSAPAAINYKSAGGKKILTMKKPSHFNGVTSSPTEPVDKVWIKLLMTGIMQ